MDLNLFLDPTKRDEIVASYKDAGLGGERYGVVCGIVDEETRLRCNKRICPQGWAFAVSFENAGKYCLHRENYDGSEPAENITIILEHHGLPWRPLRTLTRMRENKPNKKKKKVTSDGEVKERSGNGEKIGRRVNTADVVRRANRHGEASGTVSGAATFGDLLPDDVGAASDASSVAPSDGESGRARLFLARREREAGEEAS